MEVNVVRAGMLTTVQDLGRPGHRAAGIPLSGAMDSYAMRIANLLVGNPEDAAGLEFTLTGPELIFRNDTLAAAGGGDFGVPRWRPLRMRAGEPVRFTEARAGCRGYFAVAGGFAVPPVLGSASTYLRGGFGGWRGRALRDGDVLEVAESKRLAVGHWRMDERILPAYSASPILRVLRGVHADDFGSALLSGSFAVSPQSDRMGVRLAGTAVVRSRDGEIQSAPVVPGTIQVPPDGQPIILMADAQTLGGYPQAAHVITVDLPLVAQLRPGDAVRFREVSLAEAHELVLARERGLATLREGLAGKFTSCSA
jgi:antagonist of KipI